MNRIKRGLIVLVGLVVGLVVAIGGVLASPAAASATSLAVTVQGCAVNGTWDGTAPPNDEGEYASAFYDFNDDGDTNTDLYQYWPVPFTNVALPPGTHNFQVKKFYNGSSTDPQGAISTQIVIPANCPDVPIESPLPSDPTAGIEVVATRTSCDVTVNSFKVVVSGGYRPTAIDARTDVFWGNPDDGNFEVFPYDRSNGTGPKVLSGPFDGFDFYVANPYVPTELLVEGTGDVTIKERTDCTDPTATATATATSTATSTATATQTATATATQTATATATSTATSTATATQTATTSPPATTPAPSTTPPSAYVPRDLYEKPGLHFENGRKWFTKCEPYSQTIRCQTDIWSTEVVYKNGKYMQQTGWHFNNLTYLPLMKRAQWASNPLGYTGKWTSTEGRKWRTECDTSVSGGNGCRSFIWTNYITSKIDRHGNRVFYRESDWVFNNQVRFLP